MIDPQAAGILVRPACERDLPDIAALYAHEVLTGVATYELEPPAVEEMAARWQATVAAGYPYRVAERAGRFAGYAYAGPYRTRAGYRWTVEDTVYIHPDAQGVGVGRALLADLIDRCTGLGFRQMVAVIGDRSNAASIALHERMGFATVAVFPGLGRKFGRWLDTVQMQRALGPGATEAPDERRI